MPTLFNKAASGFTSIIAISVIALSIMGLAATNSGPFNSIIQIGTTTHGVLLGTSIFVLFLDLMWVVALCKKTKESSVSQMGLSQSRQIKLKPPKFLKIEEIKRVDSSSSFPPKPELQRQGILKFPPPALASEGEEINAADFSSYLPDEILLKTLGYLSITHWVKCTEVCKRWRRLTFDATLWDSIDLRKMSPHLKIFDESDWASHIDLSLFGLTTGDAPPLDKRQAFLILKICLVSLQIEGNAGVTLLTIPKGLTINKLLELSGLFKKTSNFIWDRIIHDIGNISVDKTYRIVITNNVFKESRNLSISAHENLLSKIGCEMPKILEVIGLLVVTFLSSKNRLYNDNPITYTRCADQIERYHGIVGGFSFDGNFRVSGDNLATTYYGVAGVLRNL